MIPANNPSPEGTQPAVLWDKNDGLATWGQVYSVISANERPCIVWVGAHDDTVPPGEYDLRYAILISRNIADNSEVVLQNGAVFRDLSTLNNIALVVQPTSAPALVFTLTDSFNAILLLLRGAQIQNSGSVPAIKSNGMGIIVVNLIQCIGFSPISTAPLLEIDDGDFSALYVLFCGPNFAAPANQYLAGGPGSTLAIIHDGSIPAPFPLFAVPSVYNAPTGQNGGGGPTANRPSAFIAPVSLGCMYFDTTIAPPRPVFWAGAAWVDATGAPA